MVLVETSSFKLKFKISEIDLFIYLLILDEWEYSLSYIYSLINHCEKFLHHSCFCEVVVMYMVGE